MKLVSSPIVIAPLRTRKAPATSRKMLTIVGTPSSNASNVLRNLMAPNRALRNREAITDSLSVSRYQADFRPAEHALSYEQGGAACLSVLTDAPYFQGHEDYLMDARAACSLPVLRKDFMVDPWQVTEACALGADAILIIVAALSDAQMAEIEAAAIAYGMDVLVEVHDAAELDRALKLRSPLLGINNRNLKTLQVDLATTEALAAQVPGDLLLVSESGLSAPADLARMARAGATAFLIGESLMRHDDVAAATRALLAPDARSSAA